MALYPQAQLRVPYDIDGTTLWIYDGSLTSVSGADLNKETASGGITIPAGGYLIFLRPRSGVYISTMYGYGATVFTTAGTESFQFQYSLDTTTGTDGTWGTSATSTASPTSDLANPTYTRTWLTSGNNGYNSGVRIYSATGMTVKTVHLYGFQSTGMDVPQVILEYVGNNSSQQTIDATDFQRGNTINFVTTDTYKLKNQSSTLTANTINLFFEAPTPPSPSGVSEHQLRLGSGGSWGTTASISSLAPGTRSAQYIHIRRVVAANAVPGPWVYRLRWSVGSWT